MAIKRTRRNTQVAQYVIAFRHIVNPANTILVVVGIVLQLVHLPTMPSSRRPIKHVPLAHCNAKSRLPQGPNLKFDILAFLC